MVSVHNTKAGIVVLYLMAAHRGVATDQSEQNVPQMHSLLVSLNKSTTHKARLRMPQY